MCFGCSKEPSHGDSSFEYPQHMFWLRNKKNNFKYTLLSGGMNMVSILHGIIPSSVSFNVSVMRTHFQRGHKNKEITVFTIENCIL